VQSQSNHCCIKRLVYQTLSLYSSYRNSRHPVSSPAARRNNPLRTVHKASSTCDANSVIWPSHPTPHPNHPRRRVPLNPFSPKHPTPQTLTQPTHYIMAEGSAVPTASKGSWGSFLKVSQHPPLAHLRRLGPLTRRCSR
jgi:hypothetical protein